jgi:plastocyanin
MTGRHWWGLVVAAVSVVTGPTAWGYEEVDVPNGGAISGIVRLRGDAPAPKKVEVTKDLEVCGRDAKFSEELVVSPNGGIRYAVVSLTDVKKGKKVSRTPVELDQRGCSFRPHVVVLPAGGTLDILNSDGILHNVHTYSTSNPAINKAMPKFKKRMSEKFDRPEFIRLACDAHAWMGGWIVVAANPYYAVTDQDGLFKVEEVPPGTYTLEVWHESLGRVTREVTVKPKEETKLTLELARK